MLKFSKLSIGEKTVLQTRNLASLWVALKVLLSILDELVKSPRSRHPGEGRGPESLDFPGFRPLHPP